jgi:hypothetical protein
MVRHGKNKKGRSVSRQNKAMSGSYKVSKYKNPRGLFTNEEVKKNWVPDATPLENLKRIGLKARVNDDVSKVRRGGRRVEGTEEESGVDVEVEG